MNAAEARELAERRRKEKDEADAKLPEVAAELSAALELIRSSAEAGELHLLYPVARHISLAVMKRLYLLGYHVDAGAMVRDKINISIAWD